MRRPTEALLATCTPERPQVPVLLAHLPTGQQVLGAQLEVLGACVLLSPWGVWLASVAVELRGALPQPVPLRRSSARGEATDGAVASRSP